MRMLRVLPNLSSLYVFSWNILLELTWYSTMLIPLQYLYLYPLFSVMSHLIVSNNTFGTHIVGSFLCFCFCSWLFLASCAHQLSIPSFWAHTRSQEASAICILCLSILFLIHIHNTCNVKLLHSSSGFTTYLSWTMMGITILWVLTHKFYGYLM